MNYWLMKSEPEEFSIDDLSRKKSTLWTGVRNYQARNFMTQQMNLGDSVLFYHSNAEPPGVAGIAKVSKLAVTDPLQFDSKSEYYDSRSKKENPTWHCVEVEFIEKFNQFVSLEEIRKNKKLQNMLVIKKGMRLSIQPVKKAEFDEIVKMSKNKEVPNG